MSDKRIAWLAGLLVGANMTCTEALAGRPLITEDAGVLEARDCEWESAAVRTTTRGQPRVSDQATQVGCGIGLNSQIALAAGRSRSDGISARSLSLTGKTGLHDGDDGQGTALTLAWGVLGNHSPGASLRHELSFLNLVASRPLPAGFTGHANLGLTHSRSERSSRANWNLALEWSQQPGLEWMAEVYGVEREKPWLGLGWRWTPGKDWNLNASWAQQQQTPRVKLLSLGFKLAF